MMKWEADALRKHPPRLAEGETMPERPNYWLIWVLDEKTHKPYASRCCWDKVLSPVEACQKACGMIPSANMLFFPLGHRITDARKALRRAQEAWPNH
jgi:hypothetical protein